MKILKKISVLLLIMLTSCSMVLPLEPYRDANVQCSTRGGVRKIELYDGTVFYYVTCYDNTLIKIRYKNWRDL
jgi:hypothetical protein